MAVFNVELNRGKQQVSHTTWAYILKEWKGVFVDLLHHDILFRYVVAILGPLGDRLQVPVLLSQHLKDLQTCSLSWYTAAYNAAFVGMYHERAWHFSFLYVIVTENSLYVGSWHITIPLSRSLTIHMMLNSFIAFSNLERSKQFFGLESFIFKVDPISLILRSLLPFHTKFKRDWWLRNPCPCRSRSLGKFPLTWMPPEDLCLFVVALPHFENWDYIFTPPARWTLFQSLLFASSSYCKLIWDAPSSF